jgi:hypothetical protein
MILTNITVAEGPNEWSSIYDRLIIADMQIPGEQLMDEKETSLLLNEIEEHFPSLIDYESGGLKKSPLSGSRGALLALLVEMVAVELQAVVHVRSVFSDTQEHAAGEYRIVFACEGIEEGMYAARAAVEIVQALISRTPFDLNSILKELIQLHHVPHTRKAEAA